MKSVASLEYGRFAFSALSSRGEQREDSDVDVCVEMEPRIYLVVRLQRYLEQLLECPVDLIRKHSHMNPYLLQNIEHDGIFVIGEA